MVKNKKGFEKMWKKITLSISICLITIICFALMGSKVFANSGYHQSSDVSSDVYFIDENLIKRISLVTTDTLNDERIIIDLGIDPTIYFNASNFNENTGLSTGGIVIESSIINQNKINMSIDVDSLFNYNEIILDFSFLNFENPTTYIQGRGSAVFNFVTIYHLDIYYYNNSGYLEYTRVLGPISFTYSANASNEQTLYYLYPIINNLLVNQNIEYDKIAYCSNARIGYGSENTFYGYNLEIPLRLNSNGYDAFINEKININNDFNLYEDFLQPILNLFFEQELFWGLSIGGIIGIVIAIPCTIWILKIFFGG